jgi:hypothetical protein
MKRKLLLKLISEQGAVFVRHGSNHDIYENIYTKVVQQIPRHADIRENLAKDIIKKLSK